MRIRFINAASDTVYTVALGGHRLSVTHTDGHAVRPKETGAFYIGMGERYDVTVTLGDGAFPLVALPFGKDGRAQALVRTAAGQAPSSEVKLPEFDADILIGSQLLPAEGTTLPAAEPDDEVHLHLTGQMAPYRWEMNGAPYGKNKPLEATEGRRLRINVMNMSMMSHPLHLHGPAFALADSGLRKDTLMLAPMDTKQIDLDPVAGDWMVHCHNIYHAESGMMILLSVAG